MLRTTDSSKALFTLISALHVLVLFAMISCSSKSSGKSASVSNQPPRAKPPANEIFQQSEQPSYNADLQRRVDQADSEIRELRSQLTQAENKANQADSKIQELRSDNVELEEQVEAIQSDADAFQNHNADLKRRVDQADSEIRELRSQLTQAENKANQAREQLKQANEAKTKVESEIEKLRKLVALVPQAEVHLERVIPDKKFGRGEGIKIVGNFSVSNRKGHKLLIMALFYEDGMPLRSRNRLYQHKDQVAVFKDFTPEYVRQARRESFELFIPFSELDVLQKRDLTFEVRVYDEATGRFLDEKPPTRNFTFDPSGEPKYKPK